MHLNDWIVPSDRNDDSDKNWREVIINDDDHDEDADDHDNYTIKKDS